MREGSVYSGRQVRVVALSCAVPQITRLYHAPRLHCNKGKVTFLAVEFAFFLQHLSPSLLIKYPHIPYNVLFLKTGLVPPEGIKICKFGLPPTRTPSVVLL